MSSASDAAMSTLSTAASSLGLPSFAPKAVGSFPLKPTSFSPLALSLRLSLSLKSLSASLPSRCFDVAPTPRASPASRFLRRVAVSSDIDQQEEGEGGFLGDGGARAFSPDLKLFVGNLPFSVDSSQLAGLFESAGNVEMVEVIGLLGIWRRMMSFSHFISRNCIFSAICASTK